MHTKILRYLVAFTIIAFCAQTVIGIKQSEAANNTSAEKEIVEIQKVWEKLLNGYIDKDINSVMKEISPNYTKSIDGSTIRYEDFKKITEISSTDFFNKHPNCSLNDIKIRKSNIKGNKAVVDFEYHLYAFDKDSMQWVTYGITQEVTFAKEHGKWKIVTTGNRNKLT